MENESSLHSLRLGPFIIENLEAILEEWERFARAKWEGQLPGPAVLRNDAELMLRALVMDMATEQSAAEQQAKSEGDGPSNGSGLSKAAMGHALARVNDGFDIDRMAAEFRALRASVSRLWWNKPPGAAQGADRRHGPLP